MKPHHVLLVAAVCALSQLQGAPAADAPNFVIIFADDMPPGHVGAYGGRFHTPAIDSLAASGIRFTEAFCVASMCTPSRYSMLTARYPGRCQAASFREGNPLHEPYNIAWNTALSDDDASMGELFSALGYQTGFVGKWHLAGDAHASRSDDLPSDADVSDPKIQDLLRARHERHREVVRERSGFQFVQSVLWQNFDNDGMAETGLRAHNFEWILNGALEFLDSVSTDRPFLLYFASTAVHGPEHSESIHADPRISPAGRIELPSDYYPPRSQIIDEVRRTNDGALPHIPTGMLSLDYQVAAIRKKLAERSLDQNTIILYLSDHGIEPGKATSYLRGTRIPLIANWLGRAAPSRTSSQIVQICDVLPTLWDLATGGKSAPVPGWDGVSFANVLLGRPGIGRRFAYFENGYTRSVYRDGLHYIAWRYPESLISRMRSGALTEAPDHIATMNNGQASITMEKMPGYWDPDQLYDLRTDPYEQHNVFGEARYKEQVTALLRDLGEVLATFPHPFPLDDSAFQRSPEFGALTRPRIERGTGYIYWYKPGMHAWPPE